MISIKQQKSQNTNKFGQLHIKKQSLLDFEIPENLHQLLRLNDCTKSQLDEITKKETITKILSDEQNNINFYDIPENEIMAPNAHMGKNFKSLHQMQDFATLRTIKLFSHKDMKKYEIMIRDTLKNDPDSPNQMLLAEIYEKLEQHQMQDDDLYKQPRKLSTGQLIQANQEFINPDEQSVGELDSWMKKKDTLQVLKNTRRPEILLKSDSLPVILEQKLIKNKQQAIDQTKNKLTLPKIAASNLQKGTSMTCIQEDSVDHYKAAVKNLNSNFKNLSGDIDIVTHKIIEQYQQVVKVRDGDKIQVDVDDFSANSLQAQLVQLLRFQVEFTSEFEKANFYKKQTKAVLKKSLSRMKKNEEFIREQTIYVGNLRLDTCDINLRLVQIATMVVQLVKEIEELVKRYDKIAQDENPDSQDTLLQMLDNKSQLQDDHKILLDSQDSYRIKLKQNLLNIQNIDQEVLMRKREEKKIHRAHLDFNFYLLSIGMDCRNIGISWIIQDILQKKEKVTEKNMPDFLDQKAKEFLIIKAKKMQDIDDLKTKQSDYFRKYQSQSTIFDNTSLSVVNQLDADYELEQSQASITISHDPKKFAYIDLQAAKIEFTSGRRQQIDYKDFKEITMGMDSEFIHSTELLINAINNKSKISVGDLVYREAQRKFQNIKKQNDKAPDQTFVKGENAIKQYEIISKKIESEEAIVFPIIFRIFFNQFIQLLALEDVECDRIVKEFEFKSYGRRFSVKPETVLSSLFGAIRASREIIKHKMKRKRYD